MFMALVFALNQVLSHGFGLFLFAALVPMMRDDIAISHWHLALVGALTQIAYLAGALLLGVIGHRVGTSRLSIIMGLTTTSLLFCLSMIEDPVLIIALLTVLAACASISWGTIVEIISRHANPSQCATYLTTASSGTAWGYAINGALILFIVPLLGWQASWLIAALFGALVMGLTSYLLLKLKRSETKLASITEGFVPSANQPLSFKTLLRTVIHHQVAFFACLVCLLVGFATMPFANWLNTYLDSLGLAPELGGYTWTTAGISGMFAGFLVGKLADTKGHSSALMLIFCAFFVCILAFLYDPAVFAPVAGFGYGLMYFPMWGVIAGWVSQSFGATATMQINGICMVTFGLGGTVGNLLAGYIYDVTQSLELVYVIIAVDALMLVFLGVYIISHQKRNREPLLQAS
ncbi:putative membrane protein [Marinomonas sp. MED121]|uniref:MFS transporter n=1 Tax=Marinomonas sp. MED121 TaxID=314277 RepID=UPI00006910DA|nr:MFS transporter [Marinomonas sp. MED121]EAQ67295.1 putative membrane protein [Marinomonas sp. MED121]